MATGNFQRREYSTFRDITNGQAVASGTWELTDEEKRAKIFIVNCYRYGYFNSVAIMPGSAYGASENVMPGQQNIKFKFFTGDKFQLVDTGSVVFVNFVALGIK